MDSNETVIHNFLDYEMRSRHKKIKRDLNRDGAAFKYRKEFHKLKGYLDEFISGKTVNRFFAMPGLRSTGKTTILYQLYDYLNSKKEIDSNQILYISGEKLNNLTDFNFYGVIEYFVEVFHNKNLLELDKPLFVFIDEAQYDKKWSLWGKIIFDETDNIFMVFTGSSALDIEINVDAARRLLKIPINSLNYKEFISLKYDLNLGDTKRIKEMIFSGNVDEAKECERKIQNNLINSQKLQFNEWKEYLKYGGFPSTFINSNHYEICERINAMVNRTIQQDFDSIENMYPTSKLLAQRLIRFLALQKPGENSKNKLANMLGCSVGLIQNLLNILEKSHLIFHVEPFSSSSKRIRKSWKYYCATSSMRHLISEDAGNTIRDLNAYYGILSENLVASTLKTISKHPKFDIFYDPNKGGVDFLIRTSDYRIIPIEVGFGKKSKKQISTAISRYGSEYGIIVSNTTSKIEKDDDVIYLPLETFSYI